MAYFSKGKFEANAGAMEKPRSLSSRFFKEKEFRFGSTRFSVMLPRKAFADLIISYPPAGAA